MRRPSGLTVAVAIVVFTLVVLGSWQLQRRAEKLQLIAQAEEALKAVPQPFPPDSLWPSTQFEKLTGTKVVVEGHFANDREIHLYRLLPHIEGRIGGVGWDIVQAFEINGGGTVFVDRGFVPDAQKEPAAHPPVFSGEQRLEGLVRAKEERNWLTPEDNAQKNQWFSRDPANFAQALGLDQARVAPVIIEQITRNATPLPQASDGHTQYSNRHLEYAVTWYALAFVLIMIFLIYRHKRNTPVFVPEPPEL